MRHDVVIATSRDVGGMHNLKMLRKASVPFVRPRSNEDQPLDRGRSRLRKRSVPISRFVAKIQRRLLATICPAYELSTLNQLLYYSNRLYLLINDHRRDIRMNLISTS